jgi:hypothetical protein
LVALGLFLSKLSQQVAPDVTLVGKLSKFTFTLYLFILAVGDHFALSETILTGP